MKAVNDVEGFVELTKQLVAIPSVNGTPGEVDVAEFVVTWLKKLPYFRRFPHRVWTQEIPGDPLGRKNVFAWVKGQTPATVLLHGHLDTVGIEDYGPLQELAFQSDALKKEIERFSGADDRVKEQAASGNWLFGRGALDMKGGVAVHMKLVEFWSNRPEEPPGSILFMANPVEENQHSGIMAALSELLRLREQENLQLICAVNADYITAGYEGDSARYLYTGATGKLLLNVLIRGRETHVGEAFGGLDPVFVMAECLRELNYNPELCDRVGLETGQPPVALYARDLKPAYNVQTAGGAWLYFNWFVLNSTPEAVLAQVKRKVEAARDRALALRNGYMDQYTGFAEVKGQMPRYEREDMPVLTFSEWLEGLEDGVRARVDDVLRNTRYSVEVDQREATRDLVERCLAAAGHTSPLILLYYSSPFCPRNRLQEERPDHRRVLKAVEAAAGAVASRYGEVLKIRPFFPYLSDSSYLNMVDEPRAVHMFTANFPGWGTTYSVPLDEIRKLSIPAINLGVYGFDAHKWTERLYIPYSFGVLPKLIQRVVEMLWENRQWEEEN